MAYEFSGSSQYMTATAPTSVRSEPVTICARWWTDNTTAAQIITNVSSSTNDRGFGLAAYGQVANDPLTCDKYADNGAYGASQYFSFTSGSWHHGASVLTSTTSRTVYYNGTTGTTNTTSVGTATVSRILIGVASNTNGSLNISYLDGRAAEIALWSAALTSAEITSLSKGFKPTRVRPQSLVVYLPLVRVVQDLRGGITVTNTNATYIDHPRVY